MERWWCDDEATIPTNVDSRKESDFVREALSGMLKKEVKPSTSGAHCWCVRKVPLSVAEDFETVVPSMARIDVQYHQPADLTGGEDDFSDLTG